MNMNVEVPQKALSFVASMQLREECERTGLYPVPYFATATGYTVAKIERNMKNGMWRENEVWVRGDDGATLIFMPNFNRWVERAPAIQIDPGLRFKAPEPIQVRRPSLRTALYRHFNAEGELLYVGVSLSIVQRLAKHVRDSHWSSSIASVTVEWFPSREDALNAEKEAIQRERPKHNIIHAKH